MEFHGEDTPVEVKIRVGPDGKFKINNTGGNPAAGTVELIADIVGYFSQQGSRWSGA